jgi:DNA-binding GntR family transcriptional regulator
MDGVPTVLQSSRFALARLGGLPEDLRSLDLAHESIYRVIERLCGVIAARADYTVEARSATAREAQLLEIPTGTPLLHTTQVTFNQHGEPFELHWSAYPHDRYRFQATLVRPTAHPAPIRARRADRAAGHAGGVHKHGQEGLRAE